MPIRIAVLAPARYPARVRNTDLRQGSLLAAELGRFSRIPAEIGPLAGVVGIPGVLGPLAVARALAAVSDRFGADVIRRWGGRFTDRLTGLLVAPPTALGRVDAVVGHGLYPWPPPGPRGPAVLWGPGLLPEDSRSPEVATDRARREGLEAQLRRRAASVDAVFLTVRGSEDRWHASIGAPALVRRIPYFMPHLPRSDATRPERSPGGATLEVLFVGGEARRKNLPRLVEACGRLVNEGKSLRLSVVSNLHDGPVDLDRPWIRHLGPQPQAAVQALMKSSDVLCVPSTWESFGLVYAEAMAAGLPVVAPDLPIQRANLGEAALLAAPEDAHAIADALDRLRDPAERARRSEAGWSLFVRDFAPDVVATQFVRLAEEAVAAKR